MKIKYVLLNVLPLPLWIGYYLITFSDNELFMMPSDDTVSLIIILAFTLYNLFSRRVIEFVIRNLISVASFAVGCLITGQMYLELSPHMSDEHYAVIAIPVDIAIGALVVTAIACSIGFVIVWIRKT